ncbi:hypothetical protein [Cellulosimicrobium sp. Marseille-Q4280]|nr:hypothetical protein [Cellulosimicrobium sp. Marseille-Q4280]
MRAFHRYDSRRPVLRDEHELGLSSAPRKCCSTDVLEPSGGSVV